MSIEIKIPSFGESVLEATVGQIFKASGSVVKADEEILELETDKLNQALYAPAEGKLSLTVKTGDVVKVGQTIGTIDTAVKEGAPVPSEKPMAAPAPSPKQVEPPPAPFPKQVEAPPPSAAIPEEKGLFPARKGVDEALSEMGKGPSAPLPEKKGAPIEPASKEPAPKGRETRKPMTKLRKVIAQRLVEVKNQTAMLTTFNELDMTAVMEVRKKEQENFQKKHGIKLGFMSFFIKASVQALEEFPDINAKIVNDEIVYHHYYDIGVAVSTEKGLMVPVIRNADQLSYAEIEKKLKEFAEKARGGQIAIDDLQGGTFTITNGGTFGSLLSTPILNPPQSGILGMHNIVKRPVAVHDKVEIRPMMYLALSYDHRIVDGKEAISFLMHIKQNLEEPARLLLDL